VPESARFLANARHLPWVALLVTACKTSPPVADPTRVSSTPSGAASSIAASEATASDSNVTPPPGTIVPELAGKWCYMANVNAKDGGRQTSTCFTLNLDGTYLFRADGSAPAPFTTSASPSSDVGHWVASTDTLSLVSASGTVTHYVFTKKNDPKTSDPMLVLSGQPFVTVFQKPPW
jgi:hypothetical protein